MFKKKYDLAIINRSFWPECEILGEAKLRLAEKFAQEGGSCVITQSSTDIKAEAKAKKRGRGVRFFVLKSRTNSSSGIFYRVVDAISFGLYVFLTLCIARPKHVYVSTNPPVIVPFLVFIYSTIFRAQYTYHLQDIHPEIANVVLRMNKIVFRVLRYLDNITLRNANNLITLSDSMAQYLKSTSRTKTKIALIQNPSFEIPEAMRSVPKSQDFVFCGNAGRVQQMPVLLGAIEDYVNNGGKLKFTFAGGGVYATQIENLSRKYTQVTYLGYVKSSTVNSLVTEHRWALLPLEDEVTKYAFPSKSSSYLLANCRILTICGTDTTLAKWVVENGLGANVPPVKSLIVDEFFRIETTIESWTKPKNDLLISKITIAHFVEQTYDLLKNPNVISSQNETLY